MKHITTKALGVGLLCSRLATIVTIPVRLIGAGAGGSGGCGGVVSGGFGGGNMRF